MATTTTDHYGNTWTIYETAADYITENITPGLGDVELTNEQAQEIADKMLIHFGMADVAGHTTASGLVENPDLDFWDVVAEVLGDK